MEIKTTAYMERNGWDARDVALKYIKTRFFHSIDWMNRLKAIKTVGVSVTYG